MSHEQIDVETFHALYDNLEMMALNSIDALRGPRHPAQKYYQARKNKQTFVNVNRSYKSTTNPERSDKRAKERSHQKYNYKLSQ